MDKYSVSVNRRVLVRDEEGIFGKRDALVNEHRLVMAQHLGRPLRSDEFVRHVNHDTMDNRIENLEIVSPSDHAKIIRELHGSKKEDLSYVETIILRKRVEKLRAKGYFGSPIK